MKHRQNPDPILTILVGKKKFNVRVEHIFSTNAGDKKSGVVFSTINGVMFFAPFEKFSFV